MALPALPDGVQKERIHVLRHGPVREGSYVALWVQQDVRAQCNHALEVAATIANAANLPLCAVYGLFEHFPNASSRAFAFLCDGLADLQTNLKARGVPLVVRRASPPEALLGLDPAPAAIIVDCGYAPICREWRARVAASVNCLVLEVETNVVVPQHLVSNVREPSAATFRQKQRPHLARFVKPLPPVDIRTPWGPQGFPDLGGVAFATGSELFRLLDVEGPPPCGLVGGETAALQRLAAFLPAILAYGSGKANSPANPKGSRLSPYLHFGYISPLTIVLRVRQIHGAVDDRASGVEVFLDEVIVRRELARNRVRTCAHPTSFDGLPDWAQATLLAHAGPRPGGNFPFVALERGETNDPHWNAAQWQLVATGHMHNYMRMYWAKQILAWTPDPREAFRLCVLLNDRYQLDGRDENGWMGIAWCFGEHDREFPERPVFGSVRPMTRSGLEAKFDMAKFQTLARDAVEAAAPWARELLPREAFRRAGGLQGIALFFRPLAGPPDAKRRAVEAGVGDGAIAASNTNCRGQALVSSTADPGIERATEPAVALLDSGQPDAKHQATLACAEEVAGMARVGDGGGAKAAEVASNTDEGKPVDVRSKFCVKVSLEVTEPGPPIATTAARGIQRYFPVATKRPVQER
mmetsp:Transcript_88024/g.247390  ORF Transcript_88024/g.247390 Transcript_88024/m.247390 type:complete len:639 (+) Transcript_88024:65-1981(+)